MYTPTYHDLLEEEQCLLGKISWHQERIKKLQWEIKQLRDFRSNFAAATCNPSPPRKTSKPKNPTPKPKPTKTELELTMAIKGLSPSKLTELISTLKANS